MGLCGEDSYFQTACSGKVLSEAEGGIWRKETMDKGMSPRYPSRHTGQRPDVSTWGLWRREEVWGEMRLIPGSHLRIQCQV